MQTHYLTIENTAADASDFVGHDANKSSLLAGLWTAFVQGGMRPGLVRYHDDLALDADLEPYDVLIACNVSCNGQVTDLVVIDVDTGVQVAIWCRRWRDDKAYQAFHNEGYRICRLPRPDIRTRTDNCVRQVLVELFREPS